MSMNKFYLLLTAMISFFMIRGMAQTVYEIPPAAESINACDLDLDGDMDIILGHYSVCNYDDITFTILKDEGDNSYEISDTTKTYAGAQYSIFAERIDEDEYPDLVTVFHDCEKSKNYVRIWYNDGEGNFDYYEDYDLFASDPVSELSFGDADGDGLTDIFVRINYMSSTQQWGVLYNYGNRRFSKPVYRTYPDSCVNDIEIGDLNNDKKDDVVVTTGVEGKMHIFYSTGRDFREYCLTDVWYDYTRIVDFDGDGLKDIATVITPPGPGMGLMLLGICVNQGNEEFEPLYSMEESVLCQYVGGNNDLKMEDMNNDGLPDWVFNIEYYQEDGLIANEVSGVRILYNLGNFQFTDPEDYHYVQLKYYKEGERRIHIADFNGDGYKDIATARRTLLLQPNYVDILYNDGNGNFIENPLNVEENDDKLEVSDCYPNPGRGEMNIRTALPEGRIEVYDILGKVVYKQDITEEVTKIPTEGWAKGMYLWRVYSEGKEAESGKWIKQ